MKKITISYRTRIEKEIVLPSKLEKYFQDDVDDDLWDDFCSMTSTEIAELICEVNPDLNYFDLAYDDWYEVKKEVNK